jgi:hypothetical protein
MNHQFVVCHAFNRRVQTHRIVERNFLYDYSFLIKVLKLDRKFDPIIIGKSFHGWPYQQRRRLHRSGNKQDRFVCRAVSRQWTTRSERETCQNYQLNEAHKDVYVKKGNP